MHIPSKKGVVLLMTEIESGSGTSPQRISARVAANRRNALKSTGPRTAAGKRRVALNRVQRGLCSEEKERMLRTRGEDPREFRRLCRDLIAIFQPRSQAAASALERMAWVWWEKARRVRNWVASGPPRTSDLDAQIEEMLIRQVALMREQHAWWVSRLSAVLGKPPESPADVRRQIEARLFLFGAKPGRRTYPQGYGVKSLLRRVNKVYGREAVELLLELQRQSELRTKPGAVAPGGAAKADPGVRSGEPQRGDVPQPSNRDAGVQGN